MGRGGGAGGRERVGGWGTREYRVQTLAELFQMLTRDEKLILQRARGGNTGARKLCQTPNSTKIQNLTNLEYPNASPHVLTLLGTLDALLKAPPQPPRWALLRVLALLEEERANRKNTLSQHTIIPKPTSPDVAADNFQNLALSQNSSADSNRSFSKDSILS